ncbi:hypothetical protein L3X38_000662 [Prunus dulcis]|uniref:Uncharacterized protein n=1 Tax=Prunus dulcis TaxID=3755 RepID=A0AAD4WQL5_PRUDU|nr:hypothetical protein L3X38_000662 [Prunus dulcis]
MATAVNCPQYYFNMSDVRPPNEQVSYPGDQPWHVPFLSPPRTPNHDPTSSGSEAETHDPLDKISAVKQHLQYMSKATDWWESKCDIHGQVMGNLANKLNKAYAGEVKQALKAKSRSKELESLKLKLEDTKKNALETFTQSEEYNHEMVECFNNGFEMFRDYASVISPDHNWSEIDVAGVWQVLNMGSDGMAHHSLVHAARRKDKDMDLLMDL